MVNPLNCRNYIECQLNIRIDRQCRPGESFDDRNLICLPSFAVNCGQRLESSNPIKPIAQIAVHPVHFEPVRASNAASNNGLPDCTNNLNVFLPNMGDCSKYYFCIENAPVPMNCPKGYLWNPVISQCDTPANTKCAGTQ